MSSTFDVINLDTFDNEIMANIEKYGYDYLENCYNKLQDDLDREIFSTYLKLFLTKSVICNSDKNLENFMESVKFPVIFENFALTIDPNELLLTFDILFDLVKSTKNDNRFIIFNTLLKQTSKIKDMLSFPNSFDKLKKKSILSIFNTQHIVKDNIIKETFITHNFELDTFYIDKLINVFEIYKKILPEKSDIIFLQNIFFSIYDYIMIYGFNEKIIKNSHKILRFCYVELINFHFNFFVIENISTIFTNFMNLLSIYLLNENLNENLNDDFIEVFINYVSIKKPNENVMNLVISIIENSSNPHYKIDMVENVLYKYKPQNINTIEIISKYICNVDIKKHFRTLEYIIHLSHIYDILNFEVSKNKSKIEDMKKIFFKLINHTSDIISLLIEIKEEFDRINEQLKRELTSERYDNISNIYEYIINTYRSSVNNENYKIIINVIDKHLDFMEKYIMSFELDEITINVLINSLIGTLDLYNKKMLFNMIDIQFKKYVNNIFVELQKYPIFLLKMKENIHIIIPIIETIGETYPDIYHVKNKIVKFEDKEIEIEDDELLDKLTYQLIEEPVMIPNSFDIYDKKSIMTQLLLNGTNPITREQLTIQEFENFNKIEFVKKAIKKWKVKTGKFFE